jgi:UDP-GlcNAc:undecaprenyl-phosphate GlcNAc-1-phosphate transferase
MSLELTNAVAFAVAALATYVATPLAIEIAVRTSFFDHPAGYKGHHRPTPYLGGVALLAGVVAGVVAAGGLGGNTVLVACAAGLWLLGTVDDRLSLPVVARVAVEVAIAVVLWDTGHGWGAFDSSAADLALTVVWVVGVVNAFNLMDNMDGAAATTAAVSSCGAGALALVSGLDGLAPLCFAVAGACVSFLPRNLAGPARIFMGDGGSLPIGLLVAGVAMESVSRRYLGPSGVVVGALLVALVILDTTLVTISRTRAGRPVLSGGRDHLTHRLAGRIGAPRNVAMVLAAAQLLVCGVTIAVAQAGIGWVLLAGGAGIAFGAALIWQFERPPWAPREHAPAADAVLVERMPPRAVATGGAVVQAEVARSSLG